MTPIHVPSLRAAALALVALGLAALPSVAQGQIGQFEIRATRPIPAGKIAVDLSPDSEIGRDVRRMAMDKLARRGNTVGFSGGNVMKLRVDYAGSFGALQDVTRPRGSPSTDFDRNFGADVSRLDLGPDIPSVRTFDRDAVGRRPAPPRAGLYLYLTLHDERGGQVLWGASAACAVNDGEVRAAAANMLDRIFASPDASRRGEADCPI